MINRTIHDSDKPGEAHRFISVLRDNRYPQQLAARNTAQEKKIREALIKKTINTQARISTLAIKQQSHTAP